MSTTRLSLLLNPHPELLIRAGANVNAADNREGSEHRGKTPVICASEHGHLEVVRLLIKAGADVQAVDYDGDTSMMAASQGGLLFSNTGY